MQLFTHSLHSLGALSVFQLMGTAKVILLLPLIPLLWVVQRTFRKPQNDESEAQKWSDQVTGNQVFTVSHSLVIPTSNDFLIGLTPPPPVSPIKTLNIIISCSCFCYYAAAKNKQMRINNSMNLNSTSEVKERKTQCLINVFVYLFFFQGWVYGLFSRYLKLKEPSQGYILKKSCEIGRH